MKNKIIITLVAISLAVIAKGISAADSPVASKSGNAALAASPVNKGPELKDVLPQIDAIQKDTLEIEAMYWAWRITDVKDVTYEQLEGYSNNWIMTPATKKLLFGSLKEILDGKKSRVLTAPERKKYDESLERIKDLLSPARKDAALIKSLSKDYCMELTARYWAYRAQNGEKEILDLMKKWPLKADVHKKLTSKIHENLAKKMAPLAEEELYKFDACTEKLGE